MMSTIIITASARLSPFNIAELESITVNDTMELNRIGGKGNEGRIAYFIINSPNDSTFNFIASIMYTQIFSIIDYNASHNNGSLASPCQIFCDEWSQLGVIPRYLENLAYVRGLNCGITTCLQSLSQLKKVYKDNWETALDCCDYILFMGSRSKETLEYMSSMLGKKLGTKNLLEGLIQDKVLHLLTGTLWEENWLLLMKLQEWKKVIAFYLYLV